MKPFRSILALIMALLTVVVVGCSSAPTPPPTYSSLQLEQIDRHAKNIVAMRDRMTNELPGLIQKRDWINVGNLIHGPLGTLREETRYIISNSLAKDAKAVKEAAKPIGEDLEKLNTAVQNGNPELAFNGYGQAVRDINAFLSLVPKGS